MVEPGAIQTEMLGRATTADQLVSAMTLDQRLRYGPLVHAVSAQAKSSTASALPADDAEKVIAKASRHAGRGRARPSALRRP